VRTEHSAPDIVVTLLGLALAAVLSGCGIRSTSVPVDAGAAPSRISCTVPSPPRSPAAPSTSSSGSSSGSSATSPSASRAGSPAATDGPVSQTTVPVYLVCSEVVTAVLRSVPMSVGGGVGPGDGSAEVSPAERLAAARTLLRELQLKPDDTESASGFGTDVPGDLNVYGPREGDPAALRLSVEQNQLPSFALAQIVCTFVGTAATAATAATAGPRSSDGTVVLGFSDDGPPRRFSCSSDLRTRQEAAQTAGTAVR
jgi:hypothetical protein